MSFIVRRCVFELCEDFAFAKTDASKRSHCLTECWRRRLQDLFGGQTASDQCERQCHKHAECENSVETVHLDLRFRRPFTTGCEPAGFQVSGEQSHSP